MRYELPYFNYEEMTTKEYHAAISQAADIFVQMVREYQIPITGGGVAGYEMVKYIKSKQPHLHKTSLSKAMNFACKYSNRFGIVSSQPGGSGNRWYINSLYSDKKLEDKLYKPPVDIVSQLIKNAKEIICAE